MWRSSIFWLIGLIRLALQSSSFVSQSGQSDCGVAALATVLRRLGHRLDLTAAAEQLDPDKAGSRLDALKAFCNEVAGLEAAAMSLPATEVWRTRGAKILHMRQLHYVALIHASSHGVLVFDPSLGPVFYARQDWESLYSGHALVINTRSDPEIDPSVPAKVHPAARAAEEHGQSSAPGAALNAAGRGVLGATVRLAHVSLILAVCLAIFLVLHSANTGSLLAIAGLTLVGGLVFVAAKRARASSERRNIHALQRDALKDVLRRIFLGRDMGGFRNGSEYRVASAMRERLTTSSERSQRTAGRIGEVLVLPVMALLLSPWVTAGLFLGYAAVFLATRIDGVFVCQVALHSPAGRYSRLSQGRLLAHPKGAADFLAECGKWGLIAAAGLQTIAGTIVPMALLFWVLTGILLVQRDFGEVLRLALDRAHTNANMILTAPAPVRPQRVLPVAGLQVNRHKEGLVVTGIAPLTRMLEQPDLTVREQRLILAQVVGQAVDALQPEERGRLGPLRLFGTGHDVSGQQSQQISLMQQVSNAKELPKTLNAAADLGRIGRALVACEHDDFPVFWDATNALSVRRLADELQKSNRSRVGHLTMDRLVVLEAA